MWGQLAAKALISGAVIALASEAARRNPGWGGLIASLPLTTMLAMVLIWRETRDSRRLADFSAATVLYVLAALPAFAVMAWGFRRGWSLAPALALGAAVAMVGYAGLMAGGRRLGWPV